MDRLLTGCTSILFLVAAAGFFLAFFPDANPAVRRPVVTLHVETHSIQPAPASIPAPPLAPPAPAPAPEARPAPAPPAVVPAPAPKAKPPKAAANSDMPTARAKGGTGFLSVDAVPWADVSVDAVAVDRTPIADLPLAAGVHTVELTNDEVGAHVVRKVKISAGGSQAVKVNLQAEAAPKAGNEAP
jgi:hypothetical protein